MQQQALLGILGGMGPLATVDFLGKLTRLLPASCDQEHIPWITLSQPGMPDRSQAIQNNNDGPQVYLAKGVAWLAAQSVQLIAIPCSTSHYWFDSMQAASAIPILHIADATVDELHRNQSSLSDPIAILATRGTIKAGIYGQRLLINGFTLFELHECQQMLVDQIIAQVKSGQLEAARQKMHELQELLVETGVRVAILACTELPLAAAGAQHGLLSHNLLIVDATLALARGCLYRLGYLK